MSLKNYISNIFESHDVLYICSCGIERPFNKIYYCRHCSELRCSECVSHEVDSHYCQNCLEYMPSQEARIKKNKCHNCFDCPSCFHTLSTRAISIQSPKAGESAKSMPKKVYYLVCGFCRWTSRDVGIPDQATATGGWQEAENPYNSRINELFDYYREHAHREKIEKEHKKISQRCTYLHISDKYRLSTTVFKKLNGDTRSSGFGSAETSISLPEAIPNPEPLPKSYLTEPLKLESITTLKQRHFQPKFQPENDSQLYPQNKYLHIKRSLRCKICEHNISKPEYNPSSIRFKIQLAAIYHIPELRIKSISKLYLNRNCRIELILVNPTSHPAHITFMNLDKMGDELSPIKLPPGELIVAPKDVTAEFDDAHDTNNYNDDPNFVTFRKANKLGFIATVTPAKEDVLVSFKIKHDFINMLITPGEKLKESQVVWLTHTIKLCLGKIA